MGDVRIVPLSIGTATRKKSELVTGQGSDPIEFSITMFYVRDGGRQILVDTGVPAPADTAPHHHPMGRTAQQDPVTALAGIGVEPAAIDTVVNTHLHWDHCSNNHLFPNAVIHAQRRELSYAVAPLPPHRFAYDEVTLDADGHARSLPAWLRARITPVDGDVEISENVRLMLTPGHTPGSQSVLVQGASEIVLLPGDNIPLYDNLDPQGPSAFHPTWSFVDLEAYYTSIRRSLGAADRVLPSHDPRVLDQAEYR